MDGSTLFAGLSAFPLTPATATGELMVDDFGGILARLEDSAVDSVGVLGSTGGAAYLGRKQRRRAIEAARSVLSKPLIAGVSALRTDQVIEHARDAQEAGADAILLTPMSYFVLNEREVLRLFERVNAEVTIPICIYNNVTTTKFDFSPELIGELSKLEMVRALKDGAADGDGLARRRDAILGLVAEPFSVGMSGDRLATEAMIGGTETWYSTLAGTMPEPCLGVMAAVTAGDVDEARRRGAALAPLLELMARVGGIRVMYALAELLEYSSALPPEPLLPLEFDDKAELILALEASRRV